MTVKKRYSLGGTSLVLIVFLMTYLDNGPVRRVGYISVFLEVAGLLYVADRYDAGRYLSRGGTYIDLRADPDTFRKWMRADTVTAAALFVGGFLWILLTTLHILRISS